MATLVNGGTPQIGRCETNEVSLKNPRKLISSFFRYCQDEKNPRPGEQGRIYEIAHDGNQDSNYVQYLFFDTGFFSQTNLVPIHMPPKVMNGGDNERLVTLRRVDEMGTRQPRAVLTTTPMITPTLSCLQFPGSGDLPRQFSIFQDYREGESSFYQASELCLGRIDMKNCALLWGLLLLERCVVEVRGGT